MDGFQATWHIRKGKTANSSRIPIVAMTANAMTGDREKCLNAGMDGYVSKPVKLEELDRVVKSCLAKRILVFTALSINGSAIILKGRDISCWTCLMFTRADITI